MVKPTYKKIDQWLKGFGGGGNLTSLNKTYLNTVFGQFMGVCSAYNTITFNAGEGDLYGDVLVGQTYNQTIFGCIVFVLVLEDQTFAGIVIGFTLTTPAEFDLVALEVLLVLDYFDETLKIAEDRKTKRSFSKQKTQITNSFSSVKRKGTPTN